jgi:hypothetical protein
VNELFDPSLPKIICFAEILRDTSLWRRTLRAKFVESEPNDGEFIASGDDPRHARTDLPASDTEGGISSARKSCDVCARRDVLSYMRYFTLNRHRPWLI